MYLINIQQTTNTVALIINKHDKVSSCMRHNYAD